MSGIGGVLRPGIVHRLDKDTSGVMVAAKNDAAHINLSEQIKNKTARREYIAIVRGTIHEDAGIVKGKIGRHPTERKKMAITPTGKDAVTHFRVLDRNNNFTVVSCRLETGRTHQIRVHFAHIGHPIVGDTKYGAKKHDFPITGQALHSAKLTLVHPRTGEEMIFTARLPEDMKNVARMLQLKILERDVIL